MILPKVRDPRFVTIRRGGTLTDSDHQLLALWAASCAEHVLDFFELAQPEDPRPRQAIEHARGWVRGAVKMTEARTAAGHAMAAARDLRGAARHAAYAAGQAGVVAHVAAHEVAIIPRIHGNGFRAAKRVRATRCDPQADRQEDRHEWIDMFEGVQSQPPEHVGGGITLPIGGFGMGVFVGYHRKQQYGRPEQNLGRDSAIRGR